MPVAPSPQDLLDQLIAEATARNSKLLFREGDITLAQAHGAQAMADAVLRYAAQAFRDTFIDGAKGDALTALVDDHLNLQRSQATKAQVPVAFTRTSSGAAGSIPIGTVVATVQDADGSQVRYLTDAAIAVPITNNGPFAITATAEAAGRDGNVDAATITRIVDTLFDSTFTVTNAAMAAGGNEEESDDELKRRARTFWVTLRGGTLAALEFGALTVASVRIAKATEDADGITTLVVTDSDGNSNALMVANVEAAIEAWRAAGSVVTVIGGTRYLVDVAATLVLRDGVDATVLSPTVIDAITGFMRKLVQGETMYEDGLTAVALNVDPDGIRAVSFIFNAGALTGDITPGTAQVIRPGTITAA